MERGVEIWARDDIAPRGAYLSTMRHMSTTILAATVVLPLFLTPRIAPAENGGATESERLLPSEEELRALGDLAAQMMHRFAEKIEPLADKLRRLVDDIDAYEAPERLPNGDIIIRRKPESAPPAPLPPPEGGVEL